MVECSPCSNPFIFVKLITSVQPTDSSRDMQLSAVKSKCLKNIKLHTISAVLLIDIFNKMITYTTKQISWISLECHQKPIWMQLGCLLLQAVVFLWSIKLLWKATALYSSLCMCLLVSTLKQLSSEAKQLLLFFCCLFFKLILMHTLPKWWHSSQGYGGSGGSPSHSNGNLKAPPHRRLGLCSKGVCPSVAVRLAEQYQNHLSHISHPSQRALLNNVRF